MSGFEAIGAVAAAGQFLEQGIKVVKLIHEVCLLVRDWPEQLKEWLAELETLNGIAEQIQADPKMYAGDLGRVLLRCKGHAEKLHLIFTGLFFGPGDNIARKTWRAVCTRAQEEEITKIFQTLEREKSSLQSLLLLRVASANAAGMTSIEARVDAINLQSTPAEPDDERCLRALFITDPTADRAGLLTTKG